MAKFDHKELPEIYLIRGHAGKIQSQRVAGNLTAAINFLVVVRQSKGGL